MRKPQVVSLLILIGVSMLPASAEQYLLNCNKAVFDHRAVIEIYKHLVKEGQWICGTPALMAKHKMRVACSKVTAQVTH